MDDLKRRLLGIQLVVDNDFLDKYINLIRSNSVQTAIKGVTQKHHIIPRYYYSSLGLPLDNSRSNVVNLLYRDHIVAHGLLMMCSSREDWQRYNYVAIFRMGVREFSGFSDVVDKQLLDGIQERYQLLLKDNPMSNADIKAYHDSVMRSDEVRNKISSTMKRKHERGELFSEEHRKHLSESSSGVKYVHKDGKYTSVKPDEVEKYLADGWELGGKPLSDRHKEILLKAHIGYKFSDESRKKMSESHRGQRPHNYGVPVSDEVKKKLHDHFVGTKWMNNGEIQKQVKPGEIDNFLSMGFKFGQLPKKKVRK